MRWPIYIVVTMALFLTACGEPRRASPTRPAPVDPPPSATPTAGVPASPTPTAVAATLGRLGFVENGNLWIEDVPNGQPRQVTRDGHDGSPRWSSSGKWLAFVRHDPGARSEQLWVVDAATGASRQIATGDAFDEKPGDRVAWSPLAADGTDRLAYVSNGSLYLVSPGNADPAREVVAKNPSPGLGVTGIAWSPDGKWLAYTRVVDRTPGPAGSAQTPNASLWKVRADGTRQTEIVSAD